MARDNRDFDSEERNADKKYYGRGHSGSAINHANPIAHRGRPGNVLKRPAPTNLDFDSEELNADKKYYGKGVKAGAPVTKNAPADGTATLRLRYAAEVNKIRDTIIAQFKNGDTSVTVQVAEGLEDRLEIQLDLAESREQITPVQRSAVRYKKLSGGDAFFEPVKPADAPVGTVDEEILTDEQMNAIVYGDGKTATGDVPITEGTAPKAAAPAAGAPAAQDDAAITQATDEVMAAKNTEDDSDDDNDDDDNDDDPEAVVTDDDDELPKTALNDDSDDEG